MRWRQAKRILRMDGRQTCRCGETSWSDTPHGHAPSCHGRGGLPRRWSAYQRIALRQFVRYYGRGPAVLG